MDFYNISQDVPAPVSDVLEGWSKLDFYGQRPWRPGKHSLEPPEQQREMEGIKVWHVLVSIWFALVCEVS